MSSPHQIDSLALFGSMARGDHDSQSDSDLLIVSENVEPTLKDSFIRAGYSPSVYSWAQLDALSSEGSLFLQHLKQEAKVLSDRNNRLRLFLSNFEPRLDYSSKIVQNAELFKMTCGVPDQVPALAWAFDVLAVAFRNFAILHLAQRKFYTFSYPSLVAEIAEEFSLLDDEVSLLISLRNAKNQYRQHPWTADVNLEKLLQTQTLLEKITHIEGIADRRPIEDFVEKLLRTPASNEHWYHTLRRLEGAYRSMGYTLCDDSENTHINIEKIFAQPSPYNLAGGSSTKWLFLQIKRFRY